MQETSNYTTNEENMTNLCQKYLCFAFCRSKPNIHYSVRVFKKKKTRSMN